MLHYYLLFLLSLDALFYATPISDIRSSISGINDEAIEHLVDGISNQNCSNTLDIFIQYIDSKKHPKMYEDFTTLMTSMLSKTNCSIHLFISSDEFGIKAVESIFQLMALKYNWFTKPQWTFYKIDKILKIVKDTSLLLKDLFSSIPNSLYSKILFHIVPAIHRILPHHIDKIIVLDLDLLFNMDIQELWLNFNDMDNSIIGLAHEQSPVYYHVTTQYREDNKNSTIGKPHPFGNPGFNSGVKLMNLDSMRKNILYNKYLDNGEKLRQLAMKYKFKGHLGDQDFYTLLSFEHPELFYRLECKWNRQLCQWWKYNGYDDVFNHFHVCVQPHNIMHGNCQTPIPKNQCIK